MPEGKMRDMKTIITIKFMGESETKLTDTQNDEGMISNQNTSRWAGTIVVFNTGKPEYVSSFSKRKRLFFLKTNFKFLI